MPGCLENFAPAVQMTGFAQLTILLLKAAQTVQAAAASKETVDWDCGVRSDAAPECPSQINLAGAAGDDETDAKAARGILRRQHVTYPPADECPSRLLKRIWFATRKG